MVAGAPQTFPSAPKARRPPQAGGAHSLCSRASGRGWLAPSSRRAGSLLQAGPLEFPLSSAAPPLGGGGVGSGAGWCTGPAEGSADPSDPGRPQHRLFLAGTLQVRSWQSLQGSVQAVSGGAVDRCCRLPSEGRRVLQDGHPLGVWRGPAVPHAPLQSLQPSPPAPSRHQQDRLQQPPRAPGGSGSSRAAAV